MNNLANTLSINEKRIISVHTLTRYILSGKHNNIIQKGYVFNTGCGKYTREKCNCNLCANDRKPALSKALRAFSERLAAD